MKNSINTNILTAKNSNRISLLPENSYKKNKLAMSIQNRNNSLKLFNINKIYLPNINNNENNNNKQSDEVDEKKNFINSFASTFYSTSSKQNIFSDSSNVSLNKIIKPMNHKQFNIIKAKSFTKYKKKLEINPNFLEIRKKTKLVKNKNSPGKLDLYMNDNGSMNSKENDYSLIIKKLDRWDKDNCFIKQYDKISLYKILNNYYQKKGLFEDLQNLNTMDSLLKSKSNYDKIIQNRLNYKSNKVITDIFSNSKNEGNKKIKNVRYSNKNKKLNENKSPKKKDRESDDTKLLSEKIKYETQLHNDLIFVNNILYNKKCLKHEKLKKLELIYKNRSDLKYEYDKQYNYYVKDYWLKYDEYDQRYKRLEEMFIQINKKEKLEKKESKENKEIKDTKKNKEKKQGENNDLENNNNLENNDNKNEDEEEKKLVDKILNEENIRIKNEEKEKKEEEKEADNNNLNNRNNNMKKPTFNTEKLIKEMNFIKNTKLNTINLELKKNIEKLDSSYKNKFKEVNKQKKDMEEQIQIINNELNYYKQVNDELVREHRTYYMNILKKGTDYRKEGLVWIVKNLLELQINLEYQHFPKYLTHEHIDYLIKLANLLLEQNELVVIIKVLRKKQTTTYLDENLQTYNMLDKYMEDHLKENRLKSENILFGDTKHKIDMSYGKTMEKIVQEIDKKFYKVYQNNKEIMKNYLEKNEEEVKLRNAMEHIKKGLYNSDNFVKNNQTSILDAFMCNTKNKDFFSFILKIKNRLNQLDIIINNLIKNEKDFYFEQIKKINNSTSKNFDNNFNRDIIKKSLFGEKCDF